MTTGSSAAAPKTRMDRALLAVGGVVILGAIMSLLDTTVVSVAINKPAIVFGAPLSTVQWVATGYTLALAAVIPLSAWASDRFRARRVYTVGNRALRPRFGRHGAGVEHCLLDLS